MADRPVKQPTARAPDHRRTDRQAHQVRVNGELVADTRDALTLQESTYPAVHYIPVRDVVQTALQRSDTTTYCPYKGEASYYHVTTAAGDTVDDAIWTYEQPYPAVGGIAGHVAFYPDKADISVEAA